MWKKTIFFKQIIEGNSSLRGPNTVTESKCSSLVRSTLNVPEDLHTHSQLRGLSGSPHTQAQLVPLSTFSVLRFPISLLKIDFEQVNVSTILCVLTALSTLPGDVSLFKDKEK